MEFVKDIELLGIFESIDKAFDNIFILALFVTALLIGNAVLNAKRHNYYTHEKPKGKNKTDNMKGHRLNTIYGFDQKKRLDIDAINKVYMYVHIIAAVLFFVISVIGSFIASKNDYAILAGFIAFLVSTLIGNKVANDYLGKKYANVK